MRIRIRMERTGDITLNAMISRRGHKQPSRKETVMAHNTEKTVTADELTSAIVAAITALQNVK